MSQLADAHVPPPPHGAAPAGPGLASAPPPPRLPGGLPGIGHTLSFVRELTSLLQRAYDACGEVAAIRVLGRDVVLVTGPAAHEDVFRQPDDVLSPKAAYKMMVPVFGKGVAYDCPDERMNEQLKMLLPALQHKRMRTYGEVVASEVERSLEQWGDSGILDIYVYMQALTNFTSTACLLGPEFRGELSEEFSRIYAALERGIIPLAFLHAHLPIPAFRQRDAARARLGELVAGIVERRRQRGHRGEDFLQTLMESTYKDGSNLTDHEITGMLVAAMFAGHHTSSVTVAWCLLELLRNPQWMEKVREELERVYAGGRAVDYASLRELEVTEWVIKEVLRIHPPLFVLLREALQDTTVRGYAIPKGTWVALSPLVAHQLPEVFKRPEQFCPFRFGPPDEEDRRPFAFIAFGGGRHKCLGNAFAILQVKTILAKLLLEYDFDLYGDPIVPDFHGLVVGPKTPCRLWYHRRPRAAAEDSP